MSEEGYACNICNTALPSSRARVHCLICPDYDSCADCHVTESVLEPHCAGHDYEVYMHDRPPLIKRRNVDASQSSEPEVPIRVSPTGLGNQARSVSTFEDLGSKVLGDPSKEPSPSILSAGASTVLELAASEAYWGQLLTPLKTLSPIFSRLTAAIFAHFDAESTGTLLPGEFCALMFASGFTAEQFPPLQVSTNESASPADLHQLDAWLADWIRSFPLDHRMATREFPPPPPVEPVNGRIRMRDQFLHALMYPEAPVVPNGQPLLSQLGLEQYYLYLLLHDPGSLSTRLNHLLGALPRLSDPDTGRPFEAQLIPRSCFPLIADPQAEEEKRLIEKHQMEQELRYREAKLQAEHDANMMIMQAMRNASGGWRTDSNGRRYYQEGYI
ncbi:hypothetical protein NEMBOFW57_009186 [Staphylotrichum longicolle]|uniref:ZZ-type domain-containing protein n=1 Tax=Staphylotrichum longicolle TaxID=669026 RepID=A0AAD4EWZ5_9PEZI|nr:hypothetical protein NEMBOFW57_009186 [Staphylotrichum longicolle]